MGFYYTFPLNYSEKFLETMFFNMIEGLWFNKKNIKRIPWSNNADNETNTKVLSCLPCKKKYITNYDMTTFILHNYNNHCLISMALWFRKSKRKCIKCLPWTTQPCRHVSQTLRDVLPGEKQAQLHPNTVHCIDSNRKHNKHKLYRVSKWKSISLYVYVLNEIVCK